MSENASQSVNTQNVSMPANDEVQEYRKMFGLPEDIQEEINENENEEMQSKSPEDTNESEIQEEVQGRTVKFNKEDRFVPEDEIDEYLQKGLALDKERQRKSEYEKALERAAKLAGFESHEEFMKNLDTLEEERKQKEKDQFEQLRKSLRDEAEEAGIDPDKLEQYLDNHPLLKQAKQAIHEKEQFEQQFKAQEEVKQREEQWNDLFEKYPHLVDDMDDELNAPWMTDSMLERLNRGYHPVDAYELAHKDVILQEERKKAQQQTLKQQRLNKRSQVESQKEQPDTEPEVPEELVSAFSLFDIPAKNAKKYAKVRS